MATLAALGVTGCGATAAPSTGGTFRTVLYAPDTINPLVTQTAYGAAVADLMFDSLVTVRPNLTFAPDLAERWQGSQEGKVWTFWLNPKARWWDGRPVTAQDVVFTYRLESNPASGYPWWLNDRETIASVQALGPHEVRFTLIHPDGAFLANFAAQNTGNWILPQFLLGRLPVNQVAKSPYLNNPRDMVGTGPFEPIAYQPNQSITFRANPRYFLGAPRVARLTVTFVAASTTVTAGILRQAYDLVPEVPQGAERALLRDPAVTRAYRLARGLRLSYRYLAFNFRTVPALRSRPLRWALIQATDRSQIVAGILDGDAVVANGPVPPISWAYDPHIAGAWPYSPSAARQDLSRAGYHWNAAGKAVGPNGQPLALSLTVEGNEATLRDIAAAVQAEWGAIGVQVTVEVLPPPAFVHALESGQFQVALVGWGLTADPDQAALFASNQVPPAGENFGGYDSPTVDRLLAEEEASDSSAYRRTVFWAMQEAMVQDPPGVFLYFPDGYYAVARRVRGYVFDPAMPFYQPQRWALATHP